MQLLKLTMEVQASACAICGQRFLNGRQLGAHARACRGSVLRPANNNIISMPEENDRVNNARNITLHSLCRRLPPPWGSISWDDPVGHSAIESPYIRDYREVMHGVPYKNRAEQTKR